MAQVPDFNREMLAFLKIQCFNPSMRRLPLNFFASCMLMLSIGPVAAADLQDMKLLEDDVGTRAVLNIQGRTDYKLFALSNPERLVLDLGQARLAPGFNLPAPNGAIANVRTGKPVAGTLRIVFDLGAAMLSDCRVEHEGSSTRLIVELSPRDRAAVAQKLVQATTAMPASGQPLVEASSAEQLFAHAAAVAIPEPAQPSASRADGAESRVVVPAPLRSNRPQLATPRLPTKTLHDVIGSGQRKLVVAIDAGHGGKDPGAHGPSGVREKAVTLAVARELARQINDDPGMRAVLIRDDDSFVPLKQRS